VVTELEAPILDAYLSCPEGHLAVWCIYCRCWHYHGAGDGHRVAHCDRDDSPYQKTGYTLRQTGLAVPRYKNGKHRPPEPNA